MLRHRTYSSGKHNWIGILFWTLAVVISMGVALAASWLSYQLLPRSYSATSSMLISTQPDIVAGIIAGSASDVADTTATSDTLIRPPVTGALSSLWPILTSREMLLRIVHEYDLEQKLSLDESYAVEALRSMTKFQQITNVGVTVTVSCPGARWPRNSFFLSSPLTPEEAQQLCATLANGYLTELEEYVTETNLRQARQTREFLEASEQETEAQLQRIEQEIQTLQSQHSLLDPQGKVTELLERLKAIEPAYAQAAAHMEEASKVQEAAQAQLDELTAMQVSQEIMARNPVITTLEQKLAQLQIDLKTEQTIGKSNQHPDIIKLNAEIAGTKQQLQEVKQEIVQQVSRQIDPAYATVATKVVELETEIVGAKARKALYAQLRDAVRTELAELPAIARKYAFLKREQSQQAQLLDPLGRGLGLVALVEKYSRVSRFIRLDTAVPPQWPTSAAVIFSVIIGFVVLLITGGVLIAYRRGLLGLFRM